MRWPLIVLAVLLVAAGGISFAVWSWAEAQIEANYAAWSASLAPQGWTLRSGPARRGGWPFAAELTLPELAVAGGAADLPGGVGWTAAAVTLRLDLLRPNALAVLVTGAQSLRLGPGPAVPFTADRFLATLPLAPGRIPDSATLDAAGLRFGPPAAGLTVGLLEGQFTWHPTAGHGEQAASFRLSAEAVALPPPPAPQSPLGGHIASATVEGELTGPVPSAASAAARATAWRDGGGRLVLQRIALGWGPLGVSGSAALTLDDALQPAGEAALRLVGVDDAVAALAAAHVVSAATAKAATGVFGLLALASGGGGAGPAGVEVPLTLRGGVLALDHIPLARVQKLMWPDAAGAASVAP
jgi:hypothetical protein